MDTFQDEKKHLKSTVEIVGGAKAFLETQMEKIGAFNLEKLKELRENPMANSDDFLQFIGLLEQKNSAFNIVDKYKKLEELAYLNKEPYFSRIDLADGNDLETYYIGKFGFTEANKPLILDWRAGGGSACLKKKIPQ